MASERRPSGDLRFWLITRRLLQAGLAVAVFFAVWFVGFRADSEPAVLPDTSVQFSLDMRVIDTIDHDLVYAVEQRARPMYRIFSFDPRTGEDETIFTVPEDAIVYGIALHPDRSTLAVAYSTDFTVEGNGIWLLDLETSRFDELAPTEDGVHLTELVWSTDGSALFATHVDRTRTDEHLAVASIDATTGSLQVVVEDAITPAISHDDLYFLLVDEDRARRAIGVIDRAGAVTSIDILDGERDLDHLTARSTDGDIAVAVLEGTDDGLLSFGTPAAAHGNHNIRSAWWSVDAAQVRPTDLDPIIVYDADASPTGAIVYATLEGLSIASDERVDVIRSRAIRFVAA